MSVSVEGFEGRSVSPEDVIVELDMRQAAINDTPGDLIKFLDRLKGKSIQQTTKGKLISCAYQLLIEVEMEAKKSAIKKVLPLHIIGSEM